MIVVIEPDGTTREFPAAKRFVFDDSGFLQLYDSEGVVVAVFKSDGWRGAYLDTTEPTAAV